MKNYNEVDSDDTEPFRDLGVEGLIEAGAGRNVDWARMAVGAIRIALSLIMQDMKDALDGVGDEIPSAEVGRNVAFKVLLEMLTFDTTDGEEGMDFHARWPIQGDDDE